jgi:hypothetical protein
MIDGHVRCRHLTQGFARMTRLATGLLVRSTRTLVPRLLRPSLDAGLPLLLFGPDDAQRSTGQRHAI